MVFLTRSQWLMIGYDGPLYQSHTPRYDKTLVDIRRSGISMNTASRQHRTFVSTSDQSPTPTASSLLGTGISVYRRTLIVNSAPPPENDQSLSIMSFIETYPSRGGRSSMLPVGSRLLPAKRTLLGDHYVAAMAWEWRQRRQLQEW